jgi:phage anti-repressor protein
MININKNGMVDARQLHSAVEVKTRFAMWFERGIEAIDLKQEKDFFPILGTSTGGRIAKDYDLTKEAAIEMCLISFTQKGKDIRKYLIGLHNQHDAGLAFTTAQIESLMDLSKALTLVSIQKEVESKHFEVYNNKYSWYQHRADILGYSAETVMNAMKDVNKKHRTIRESLMQLDANELIRAGAIDFMLAIGKSQEYAVNVGDLCKTMASKMDLGIFIWDDTKSNPLKINEREILKRKQNYENFKKLN